MEFLEVFLLGIIWVSIGVACVISVLMLWCKAYKRLKNGK